ncbi:hypothetical protein PsorP6_005967 [Peronosclerospora sorghi]|uniref:Uncharacterized protein n=1 Tax=Peronosclerospora sorghi TaxID=230839 RepID=A0ACC0W7X8_9STRA|nr:hypothetical protein PsorP6_005967 [Peronosclerospora sorghi]
MLNGLTHPTAIGEEEEADEGSTQRLLVNVGAPDSAIYVTDDCFLKAKLFIDHKIRLVNQQIAISKILDDMRSRCTESKGSDEALVVMDLKMKLEPLYFREKTVEHYGKK